jgi:hypothetical protein
MSPGNSCNRSNAFRVSLFDEPDKLGDQLGIGAQFRDADSAAAELGTDLFLLVGRRLLKSRPQLRVAGVNQ